MSLDLIPETYRIAMVAACPLPYDRGTPIRIFRMAEALAQQGCDVHVFTYHLGTITAEEEKGLPFRVHRIRKVPTYNKYSPGPSPQKLLVLDLLLYNKLNRLVPQFNFDLIHAHHYEGLTLGLLMRKRRGLPVIYDAHTLLESELHYYMKILPEKGLRQLGLALDKLLPIRADHIIAVTPEIRAKLITEACVRPDCVSVIMNGVETEHFDHLSCDPQRDPSIKKIVYAGNLGKFQGITHLLKIFGRIVNQRKNVRLQIITSSSFEPYLPLARRLRIEPKIDIMRASFEKLPEYLKCADLVLNTRVECDGIPQKVLNYMAAGRPVISFKGSAKIIEHKKTGYIVENGDYEEFVKSVFLLLDNREMAETLGENARKFIDEKFSWPGKAREIMAVYGRVLKRNQAI